MGYSEGMKDFWKWLTSAPDEAERRRLEREGADIDVVYGWRPSYVYGMFALLSILRIVLDVIFRGTGWNDNLDVNFTFLVASLGAVLFSRIMEKRWSWRRTGVTGILVAIAVGAAFYYIQGLVF